MTHFGLRWAGRPGPCSPGTFHLGRARGDSVTVPATPLLFPPGPPGPRPNLGIRRALLLSGRYSTALLARAQAPSLAKLSTSLWSWPMLLGKARGPAPPPASAAPESLSQFSTPSNFLERRFVQLYSSSEQEAGPVPRWTKLGPDVACVLSCSRSWSLSSIWGELEDEGT